MPDIDSRDHQVVRQGTDGLVPDRKTLMVDFLMSGMGGVARDLVRMIQDSDETVVVSIRAMCCRLQWRTEIDPAQTLVQQLAGGFSIL